MVCESVNSVEEVLRTCQITLREQRFVELFLRSVDERFRERLAYLQANAPITASSRAICEFLIYPVLQEIWLLYTSTLTIWSHVALSIGTTWPGFPDYFFARRSPLGPVRDRPYVLFVQAKKDDFDAGWGQCLAALLATQKLNNQPERAIFGCVSNGPVWYLGKLEGRTLTQDPRAFSIDDLEGLFAALNYVVDQAREQVLAASA